MYKIKEHVMAGVGRLHRDECASVWDVLTGLGDLWDLGVKGEGRGDTGHGNGNRNILKADFKIWDSEGPSQGEGQVWPLHIFWPEEPIEW